MAATKVWPIETLEKGKAFRVKVPANTNQETMIRRGKAAVNGFKRKGIAKAGTPKARKAFEAMEFDVLASGAGHVRVKRAA